MSEYHELMARPIEPGIEVAVSPLVKRTTKRSEEQAWQAMFAAVNENRIEGVDDYLVEFPDGRVAIINASDSDDGKLVGFAVRLGQMLESE